MSEMKLLAIFTVNQTNDTFNIYGNYDIENISEFDYNSNEKKTFKYAEFEYVIAKKYIDQKEYDYTPVGKTFTGHKYNCNDMINSFIYSQIINDNSYTSKYIDLGLQCIIDDYKTNNTITINENTQIPKYVLYVNCSIYQLFLVTDQYIYYGYENLILMLDTATHRIISDNCFAEIGYTESIENINAGKEKLLWGEIPSEYQE